MNLQAKVNAVNAANAAVNEWRPKLVGLFYQLVGQKVIKADGSLTAKVDKLVKELGLPNSHNLQVYRCSQMRYSLTYVAKTSEMDSEHTCMYYETSFHIGELNQGILANVSSDEIVLKTNHDIKDIMRRQDICKRLREELHNELSGLYPFGENER